MAKRRIAGLASNKIVMIAVGAVVGYIVDYGLWTTKLEPASPVFWIDEAKGFGLGIMDVIQIIVWTGLTFYLKGKWRYFAIGGLLGVLGNKFILETRGVYW